MRPLGRSSFLRDVQKIREKRLFVANLEVIEPIAAVDAVMKAFLEKDVVLMRGDWTNQDPEIKRALESHGRSGVPLYVLYGGDGTDPVLLPEILTPDMVLEALDRIPRERRSI